MLPDLMRNITDQTDYNSPYHGTRVEGKHFTELSQLFVKYTYEVVLICVEIA